MVNLPLSCAKTGAFFFALEATETMELKARTPISAKADLIFDFTGLDIVESAPLRAARHKVCHSGEAMRGESCAPALRVLPEAWVDRCCAGLQKDCLELGLFDNEVSVATEGRNDSTAENFCYDAGGFAGTVDAVVGLLIGGQTLRVKGAKAG